MYVALAEALDCELLTADRRLATATGPRCTSRLVSTASRSASKSKKYSRSSRRANPNRIARLVSAHLESAGITCTALWITKSFHDRFTPAIATSDFMLRASKLDRALDFLVICRSGRRVRGGSGGELLAGTLAGG
jgi:hypothetical protein